MNPGELPALSSLEALDIAIEALPRARTGSTPYDQRLMAAVETLRDLREFIADRVEAHQREQAILHDWVERAGEPLRDKDDDA